MWPGPTAAPGNPPPMTSGSATITLVPGGTLKLPEQDVKAEEPCKQYEEYFSKRILFERLKEYYAGKYTKRYIDTYLEFCHLSGFISNLDYLDIKDKMSKE
jgi:hypothetical protein